jgi:hypothetical protein
MLWHPDTCRNGQCIIEVPVEWDRALSVVRTCGHHSGHATEQALFTAVLGTNRVKNAAVTAAAAEMAVEPAAVAWSVNDQDVTVLTTGLNATRRTRLTNAITALVGSGKVIVQ